MPRTREENSRQGKRNHVAGKQWQADVAAWCREHGWPNASYDIRNNLNDLLGTGDLAIETTITTWDKIPEKLEVQATEGAARRGLPYPCVWKKRNMKRDPGKGLIVMVAEVVVPVFQELDRLQHLELEALTAEQDARDSFQKGFTAGVDWARANPGNRPQTMEVR